MDDYKFPEDLVSELKGIYLVNVPNTDTEIEHFNFMKDVIYNYYSKKRKYIGDEKTNYMLWLIRGLMPMRNKDDRFMVFWNVYLDDSNVWVVLYYNFVFPSTTNLEICIKQLETLLSLYMKTYRKIWLSQKEMYFIN